MCDADICRIQYHVGNSCTSGALFQNVILHFSKPVIIYWTFQHHAHLKVADLKPLSELSSEDT